ncbi:hypothetical protein QFC20_003377 [Naganishia adeliensis]|uniref:Uncharacterized protein n=1 Tax=Naganishia adeliensis TaxID=92952 RepID=A0ACC2WBC0_9TREE|nr:hypothetical protein QFC20_003377 [Naganishia adeliensis]
MDFSTLTSMDPIYTSGWEISHGWKVGSTNAATGQLAKGNETNVKVIPGHGLSLTVPESQHNYIFRRRNTFPRHPPRRDHRGGHALDECTRDRNAFMTYHADNDKPLGWLNQQGFRMLGETLLAKNAYNSAGMQLTHFDPSTGKRDMKAAPFPVDPSQDFHRLSPRQYTISWFPDTCIGAVNTARATEYRFDGAVLSGPTLYSSTHPARMMINQFTNADKAWSAGPPKTDAVMIVKKVVAYYDKPTKLAEGACPIRGDCDPSISCKVTI